MHIEQSVMDAVLSDWETAPVSDRLRAGLRLVEAMTLHPKDITRPFVDDLISDGLDVESIEEAAAVGFQYNFINRIADAFDFDTPNEKLLSRQATFLSLAGKLGHNRPPTPSWSVGTDRLVRPVELNITRDHFLSVEGSTDPSLRCSVEAHSGRARGGERPDVSIPDAITDYVNCLSLNAARLTDELFDGLREAGYSYEAIYEITTAAAFGASFASIEPLFRALHGGGHLQQSGQVTRQRFALAAGLFRLNNRNQRECFSHGQKKARRFVESHSSKSAQEN